MQLSHDENTTMCIYSITNTLNNKVYVGQTKGKALRRWQKHINGTKDFKSAIHAAIVKYGVSAFIFKVLDTATSLEELNLKESENIINLNTCSPNGYNLNTGGDSRQPSQETVLKMSNAKKGKKQTPESVAARKVAVAKFWASPASAEARRHRSELSKNLVVTDDSRKNKSIAAKEVGTRPEVKLQRSLRQLGKPRSQETKDKMSKAKKGIRQQKLGMLSSNTSGERGIALRYKKHQQEGAWCANIYDVTIGKLVNASFAVKKYGYEVAHELARKWRADKMNELNNLIEQGKENG